MNEKRSVSPDMALRLSRYFGTTPDVWLGLQVDYDLYWETHDREQAGRIADRLLVMKQGVIEDYTTALLEE